MAGLILGAAAVATMAYGLQFFANDAAMAWAFIAVFGAPLMLASLILLYVGRDTKGQPRRPRRKGDGVS